MRFEIITIFPSIFDSYLEESFLKRAQEKKLVTIRTHNLRDFTTDKHRKVDDRPFGGGPGMVLKIEPVWRAVQFLAKRKAQSAKRTKVILFSTKGKRLTSKIAKRLALCDRLILVCGRYEGVDERVAEHVADEEISVGDYVLSGGELPALILMESVCRFVPGFLGKKESLEEYKGSYPTYTRPEVFSPAKGRPWRVPKVLLSGNHREIERWRRRT